MMPRRNASKRIATTIASENARISSHIAHAARGCVNPL
jgi:hypothetical protein